MMRDVAFAYLIAYVFALTIAAGMLLLLAMAVVSRARFFIGIRRLAEAAVGTLPLLALGFVPLYLWRGELYAWAQPEELAEGARAVIESRGGFHEAWAFLLRGVVYGLVLTGCGEAMIYHSRRQDKGDPARATDALRLASGATLPLAALALTFVTFDWLMSLEPTWYSTMYGAYVFAGAMSSSISLLIVLFALCRARGILPASLGQPHRHALGTLLFTFVIFWGYAAFCQYLLIWIADLPREITYFRARTMGAYLPLAVTLVLAHFFVPFALLLPRKGRESEQRLLGAAFILLFAHYLDMHFMIGPVRSPERLVVGLSDLIALPLFGLIFGLLGRARFSRAAAMPADPALNDCLRFGGIL